MDAVHRKGAARRRPPVVFQNGAALGQVRLLQVVGRHPRAHALLQPGQLLRIGIEPFAEGGGHGLLGEVVGRGPQSAGGDDDIRPAPGDVQRLPQTARVIPHHRLPINIDAVLAEPLGDHLTVGIGDLAQQQLRPNGQQLTVHAFPPPVRFLRGEDPAAYPMTRVSAPASASATSASTSSFRSSSSTYSSLGLV